MKNYNDWEKKAEQALNSLEGIQRAEANPYLYTRIRARMDEQRGQWSGLAGFISRPAIAISATLIFISINLAVVLERPKAQTLTKRSASESEAVFASEYASVNYSLTEANNNEK